MNETIEGEVVQTDTKGMTKRDMIEGPGLEHKAFEADRFVQMPVLHEPQTGAVSHVNFGQVMDIARVMAASKTGVPKHCRGDLGICQRVVFQAVEWGMSPYSVADMSYVVNDRIAYMSQLLHAVVEARAPLQRRLDCRYDGEGDERTCTVIGLFTTGDIREYTTPTLGKLKAKGNSPLYKDDPDQQQFYFASRSWARKWCPEVLLGCYTRDELRQPLPGEDPPEFAASPGLHARLAGSPKSVEGHKGAKHINSELDKVAGNEPKAGKAAATKPATPAQPKADKRTSEPPKGSKKTAKKGQEPLPKTVKEYLKYAADWIANTDDVKEIKDRWADERDLRNKIGVTADDRSDLDQMRVDRITKIEG